MLSIAALISVLSLYFYQLPTHHCPFCLLQKDYRYVGYPLYLSLLGGVVAGMTAGLLMPARKIKSLQAYWMPIQRRLTWVTLISFLIFVVITTSQMIFTDCKLEGY